MASAVTTKNRYLADFEALERHRARQSPAWLAPLRRSAIGHFAEAGFPTTRDEDWRYTNLAPLVAAPFTPAGSHAPGELSAETLQQLALGGTDWPRLVFVDGRYSVRHSSRQPLPRGARLSSLAEALKADGELIERHLARHAAWDANVFAALSAAFVEDGAFLQLPAETSLPAPIELLFVAAAPGVLAQPRILIVAGPRSRVTVVERYVALTEEAYFTNVVTEIVAGAAATVDHAVVQEQGAGAFHVATVHATLDRDSAFSTCGVGFGAQLARTTLALQFRGEGARGALRGLYVVGGRQHVDNHVTVDHAVPRCSSQQLYKGVLDGSARAVFNGRILVRPDAQKTDANQTNKHLLLSDAVEVDSKPQLEIFADDVKCTHGAAEGQLAPEALFYLRSRGLGEATARGLLTCGFAREVVDRIAPAPLQAYVDRALMARLGTGRDTREI
jgi:Fe-S cluster assembly protein SufD